MDDGTRKYFRGPTDGLLQGAPVLQGDVASVVEGHVAGQVASNPAAVQVPELQRG